MKRSAATILYGIHPIKEAISAGRRKIGRLYVVKHHSPRLTKLVHKAESEQIPIETVSVEQLDRITHTKAHQGIGAHLDQYPYTDLTQILAADPHSLILVLDGLQDPRNLGALMRTAACVGISGVTLPKNRSASITSTVSFTSAGAVEHLRVARVTNISRVLNRFKSEGFWVAGLEPSAPQSIFTTDLKDPLVLVLGGEEKGIRPLVKKQCDILMAIPQIGRIDSLNVSVAGGVALYEVFRQRLISGKPTGQSK